MSGKKKWLVFVEEPEGQPEGVGGELLVKLAFMSFLYYSINVCSSPFAGEVWRGIPTHPCHVESVHRR